ncbi:DUF3450 domain-containing protein [Sansalvadorimonas verongulae]|uniref:hypothetical protein n=1 Tax=Sansalvadorimonas verongulae TaxID=2172824 RepID=UPI0012BBA91A|nr:hypothetical protein [Sansalvadorimonas verongulae]MTI12514.1 hypothetical protein [Sansalvadorimonas verongulae]
MSSTSQSSSIEKLQEEIKQLKAENKTLQADNPKRMKTQIKRLQDENRNKNNEITLLKTRLKKAQQESSEKDALLQEMGDSLHTLKVLEEPHWESEDKSWAIYLEVDQDNAEAEQTDFNLRLVDRKTGGAKMPHMEEDKEGKPALNWPRMRTIPKDVKAVVENLVEI